METIDKIAQKLNLTAKDLVMFGEDKAKIKLDSIPTDRKGKLILMTAMSPSPAGEGKTTTAIGLVDAMNRIGKKAAVALREPSMGPVFGMKGGGAGGGKAQLYPAEEINLHFTGDFHAVSSAHNLLAAARANHIHFGNKLGFDVRRPKWERVMDVNDRTLRSIVVGQGGRLGGVPEESRFDITAASEITAIMALARGLDDLRSRLGRIVLGESFDGELITAGQLNAVGSLVVLLKQALLPNLVQTLEGSPALVHSGPFANIAHGTNSVLATWAGMGLADYVIQEAGFGADLGAEKFVNIFCPSAGVRPTAAVLVCTLRAIRFHAGVPTSEIAKSDPGAVSRGLVNPISHLRTLERFGMPVVVVINLRPEDTEADLRAAVQGLEQAGARVVTHSAFTDGGAGAVELAEAVVETAEQAGGGELAPTYNADDTLQEKISSIATKIYGARRVNYSTAAQKRLQEFEKGGFGGSRICMAKTQFSFSDDPALVGRPEGFEIEIREARLAAGAGFVIPISGEMMTMPGLAKVPNLERIDLDENGKAILF
ncbi:MAG: formate--tetrahydrofolate ligase [Vulcanimicrobiota bacterium]